jgi:hypothetical protein
MKSATRDPGSTRMKQLRNEKLRRRYQELWQQGLRINIILDKLENEFFLSRPRIYSILNVKVIQNLEETEV